MSKTKKVKTSKTKYDWIITSKNNNGEKIKHPVSESQYIAFNSYVYSAMSHSGISPDFGNPHYSIRLPHEFSHHRSWDLCGTELTLLQQNPEAKPNETSFPPLYECALNLESVVYIYPIRLLEEFNDNVEVCFALCKLDNPEKIDLTKRGEEKAIAKHNQREYTRYRKAFFRMHQENFAKFLLEKHKQQENRQIEKL